MQEKNQESGSGNMQRKLNWFDLICIGIGELLVHCIMLLSTSLPMICN
jgi:hypothetical protein